MRELKNKLKKMKKVERARCQQDHKMSDEQMERDFRRWSESELKIEVSVGEDGEHQIQSPR